MVRYYELVGGESAGGEACGPADGCRECLYIDMILLKKEYVMTSCVLHVMAFHFITK